MKKLKDKVIQPWWNEAATGPQPNCDVCNTLMVRTCHDNYEGRNPGWECPVCDNYKEDVRVLQPTSIDKISREERFAPDSAKERSVLRFVEDTGMMARLLRPDLSMRMRGYTRHQSDCLHAKQKFTDSSMRWKCADCGLEL